MGLCDEMLVRCRVTNASIVLRDKAIDVPPLVVTTTKHVVVVFRSGAYSVVFPSLTVDAAVQHM